MDATPIRRRCSFFIFLVAALNLTQLPFAENVPDVPESLNFQCMSEICIYDNALPIMTIINMVNIHQTNGNGTNDRRVIFPNADYNYAFNSLT
jgi:hypothetical protein